MTLITNIATYIESSLVFEPHSLVAEPPAGPERYIINKLLRLLLFFLKFLFG